MASYCLPRAKAWHSLEKESAQYGPEPKVLVRSSSTVGQLFFHVCGNCSAPVKNSGV
jgi:hypothetical protein